MNKIDGVIGRLFEEMAELTFEVCKNYFRGKPNKLLIAHEIADVWEALEKLVKFLDIEDEVRFAKEELKGNRTIGQHSSIDMETS